MTYQLFIGNNLEILPTLPDNSVDSIVTDPPYGLSDNKYVAETIARWIAGERDFVPDGKGFMGKAWDAFVPPPALWDECLRVLKPGGHLLAFFGSRTQDIGALAIRLAGFEIRDSIAWLYGSGFPKSMDISKAIDKAAGAEREKVRVDASEVRNPKATGGGRDGAEGATRPWIEKALEIGYHEKDSETPATPEAQQWQGWGTALKPALEPIVVARKPIEGTVANNVLKWGTGGLNIDGSRIGTEERINQPASYSNDSPTRGASNGGQQGGFNYSSDASPTQVIGRWPANIILDPYTAELVDEQSGTSKSTPNQGGQNKTKRTAMGGGEMYSAPSSHADSGGASRFFYVAKASKRDRNEGLDELPAVRASAMGYDIGLGEAGEGMFKDRNPQKQNFHPTVKPTALMEYLVKLVTPPNGTVLDPFTGSGSTGKAAILSGFGFIGIEMTEDYVPIIEGRLKHAEKTFAEAKEQEKLEETEKLF